LACLPVIQPILVAIQRSRRVLFEPFQLSKWLRLGFCAFLMGSAPIGMISGANPGLQSERSSDRVLPDSLLTWLKAHQSLALSLGLGALFSVIALTLLFTWLSSRARFMLLDGVIRNRGAIKAPWQEYRREANSLFRFRVVLGLISLLVVLLILAGVAALGLSDLMAGEVSLRLVSAFAVGVLLLLITLLTMQLISLLLLDFVTPVMLMRRLPVLRAWPIVIDNLVRRQPGGFALYLLARLLIDGAIGSLTLLTLLFSCFLAAVPYVGAVLLLPLTVFQLSYPLAYLEQLGAAWQVFPADRPMATSP